MPTIDESRVRGCDVTVWAGLITPVGVSRAVIAKLNDAVNQAMVSPGLMEKYAALAKTLKAKVD